jgi:nicotinate dehydrogenase subunit A
MANYSFRVNGRAVTVDSWDPAQPVLYVLRNSLGLYGPKFGCGLSQCGACTVLLDGKAIRSCVTSVKQVEGRAITTLEGLGTEEKPDPVQAAFIAEQAAQCGYCTNGMIMEAKSLLNQAPNPTLEQVKAGLARNLCRCGTHTRILRAVLRAAKTEGDSHASNS